MKVLGITYEQDYIINLLVNFENYCSFEGEEFNARSFHWIAPYKLLLGNEEILITLINKDSSYG